MLVRRVTAREAAARLSCLPVLRTDSPRTMGAKVVGGWGAGRGEGRTKTFSTSIQCAGLLTGIAQGATLLHWLCADLSSLPRPAVPWILT